jgi:L-alanine-DL-glutamate epimerase-like enolase superfamily enzyme
MVERTWHILAMGRGQATADKAEKHLHELGYKNAKVIGLTNDKESDEKLIELLRERQWDGVSIGRLSS